MKAKVLYVLLFCLTISSYVVGQKYLGGGHGQVQAVYSSDEWVEPYPGTFVAKAENTINGRGLDARLMGASRFLSQATLGYDMQLIEEVAQKGIERWLEEQFNQPPPNMHDLTQEIFEISNAYSVEVGGTDPERLPQRPSYYHFLYAWWEYNVFNRRDMLRQRVAEALSEIFVVSYEDAKLRARGLSLAAYWDILTRNAFGNFYDLLHDITYSPTMGLYLSHFNNPKSDPSKNRHPDENYAREIMQLFTIGLYELHIDGTRKKDAQGNDIPTYDNDDIKELAKVFTGLSASAVIENPYYDTARFNIYWGWTDFSKPMRMYEEWHEPGEKRLFGGKVVIPAGQTGDEDIAMALQALFQHPNVGPFIARRLIQRLVKSNPTPQYIRDVAEVFNDNGYGVRGDLKAVIRAILLHPEARDCAWMYHPSNGKLREPLLRYTHFAFAMPKIHPYGYYWNVGTDFGERVGQNIMGSPSVFNFYSPEYAPLGPLRDREYVAPEFQILNTRTVIEWGNYVYQFVHWGNLLDDWTSVPARTTVDLRHLYDYARTGEPLTNYLDILFTYGDLSDQTRRLLRDIYETRLRSGHFVRDRVRLGLYLVLISPDYLIKK